MTTAIVELWGTRIGAVTWDAGRELGFFEYDREFQGSGIQLAPLEMPLGPGVFSFPALARAAFYGLPGMLADVLPDRFGNAVIDAWLASQGRSPDSFNPVERLCYTGARGMGALEFAPTLGPPPARATEPLDIAALVDLASAVLSNRKAFVTDLSERATDQAMRDILRVSTSAGGARAKAVISWNLETDEVRSGQVEAGPGFSYWLLKFDGVRGNERELGEAQGYGLIEYAYYRMALACGIEMNECRIMPEHGRHHFAARRFDREDDGSKLHLQSLGALAHLDFNLAGAHSYEQAMLIMRRLGLPMHAIEQQFRRMAFNVIARNQDDHVKNIALLMDKSGTWSLSPAFDMTYAYNPDGMWTSQQQMTINGKRDGFTLADFIDCGKTVSLRRGHAAEIVDEIHHAVSHWPKIAAEAGVSEETAARIGAVHRMEL